MRLQGSIPALITPFKADFSVDYERLGQLLAFHVAQGSAGVLILGTTGESSTMTFEEEQEMVAFCAKKLGGRLPLIVGAGSNATATAISNGLAFEAAGADALLLIEPYYNRTNDAGMLKHFELVAEKVKVPIVLYTVPGRTGCAISVNVVEKLAKHPKIIGIKDATGDFSYTTAISRFVSEEFQLYSGNDDTIVPLMALGGSGVISVWANFMPKTVADLISLCATSQYKEAVALQHKHLDLVNALFVETNPIPLKYVMSKLGLDAGVMRLPLDTLSSHHQAHLNGLLAALQQ